MTFPNPKYLPGVSATLDNAAAVDKGGGLVGLPITGHGFQAGQIVVVAGTTNYDLPVGYEIISQTTNEIVVTATYVAETFAGTETVVFGRVVILKSDFKALEDAILSQATARLQPPLVWVDVHTVRVEATADCPVLTKLDGMPNILNPVAQVSGGLSDSKIRTITANLSCDLASGGLYGTTQTEKASQCYVIFAMAADAAADFTLKAIPIMRVKSQASQTISLGNLLTPATGIGYGFTTDELAGGLIYILSNNTGTSRGLMRAISANNNDNGTGGTITYTGAALTVGEGDWLIVLPPGINFRLIGTVWNKSGSDIAQFRRYGNEVYYEEEMLSGTGANATVLLEEIVKAICPFAIGVFYQSRDGNTTADGLAPPEDLNRQWCVYNATAGGQGAAWVPATFCKIGVKCPSAEGLIRGYRYHPNAGF